MSKSFGWGNFFSVLTIAFFIASFFFIGNQIGPIIISCVCFLIPIIASYSFLLKRGQTKYILPSMWTSFGILGTFISLVASVALLGDITSIDAEFVKSFLSAFTTSIVGITGSLSMKFFIAELEKKEEAVELAGLASWEHFSEKYYLWKLSKHFSRRAKYEEKRDGELKGILDSIANSQNSMVTAFSKIRKDISDFLEAFEGQLDTAITSLTTTTGEKIVDGMTTLTTELQSKLEDANKSFKEGHEKLLDSNNKQLTEKLGETATALASMQTKLTTDFENTTGKIETGLQEIVTKLNTELVAASINISDSFSGAITEHEGRMSTLQKTYTDLAAEHVEGLKSSFKTMESVVKELSTEFLEYREQANLTKDFATKTTEAWSKNVSRFDEFIKVFEKVYTPLNELGEEIEKWKEMVKLVNFKQSQEEEKLGKMIDLNKKMVDVVNGLSDIEDRLKRIQPSTK